MSYFICVYSSVCGGYININQSIYHRVTRFVVTNNLVLILILCSILIDWLALHLKFGSVYI